MTLRNINDIWRDIDDCIKQRLQLNPGELQDRLIKILTDPSEITGWEKYSLEDPHRYTRNLIHLSLKYGPKLKGQEDCEFPNAHCASNEEIVHDLPFHLVLLAWGPGHCSTIHDHAGSECCMRVLSGAIREELYQVSHDSGTEPQCILHQKHSKVMEENDWTSIRDSIGWHRVINVSESEPAYSLHLYYPPIGQYRVVCVESGRQYSMKTCHFYSINGHLCHGQ